MTEITINLDHNGRSYVVKFNIRTRDDDDIVAFSEKLQTFVFEPLARLSPNFDGPVPSVAFAHWLNMQLASVPGITSIIVGKVDGISAILRDPVPGQMIVSAGDFQLQH
jgi:hypothetical protein